MQEQKSEKKTSNDRFTLSSFSNGQNAVSRALFRKRELTEFWGKLGELCERQGARRAGGGYRGTFGGRLMLYTPGFPNENLGLFTFMPELPTNCFWVFQQKSCLTDCAWCSDDTYSTITKIGLLASLHLNPQLLPCKTYFTQVRLIFGGVFRLVATQEEMFITISLFCFPHFILWELSMVIVI